MSAENIQELVNCVPEALPVTRQWLMAQNKAFDRHAIDNLLKSGQLTSLARGVYIRPHVTLTWLSVVCCLQSILKTDLTVGGLTALEMKGYGHYVPLTGKTVTHLHGVVHLYGKDRLPKWINGLITGVKFVRHVRLDTPDQDDFGASGLVNDEYDTGFKQLYSGDDVPRITPTGRNNAWPLTRSSPERAFLELLLDVPDSISFEYADQLMQGLINLSPRRLETLLRRTQNVKIRRLFYWFAERHQFPWFKKLPNPSELDKLGLGSGKRMLARSGKLDTKYMITIPEDMWTQAADTIGKSSY